MLNQTELALLYKPAGSVMFSECLHYQIKQHLTGYNVVCVAGAGHTKIAIDLVAPLIDL